MRLVADVRLTANCWELNVKEGDRPCVSVIGEAGFIGSHFCKRLLAEGQDLLCVDHFYTGYLRYSNQLMDNRGLVVVQHDIMFPFRIEVRKSLTLCGPCQRLLNVR
jgi:UDP-glucuronate decarboxylase